MYKIFLADDEFKVITGLLRSIRWEDLNSEVIGYSQDREDALEKILRLRPDVVMIDIQMPKKNGLEVMERVLEIYHCAFIIFSGYTEFEYAKKALQLQAVDYLIKPVNISEIECSIQKAQQTLEQLLRSPSPHQEARREWVEAVLDGSVPVHSPFPSAKNFFVTVIHIPQKKTASLSDRLSDFFSQLDNRPSDFTILKNHREFIIFCAAANATHAKDESDYIARQLAPISDDFPSKCFWTISSIQNSSTKISEAYLEAVDLTEMRDFFSEQTHYARLQEDKKKSYRNRIASITHQLLYADSEKQTKELINDAFTQAIAEGYTPQRLQGFCLELYYSIKCDTQKDFPDIASDELFDRDFFPHVSDLATLKSMQNHLLDFCSQIHQLLQNRNAGYQQRVILSCQSYVKNHLKEPITLNAVAASVNMHPAYLSHAFHKATGVTLFDYITNERIQKAKLLLKTTHLKIFEVAQECGYQDQRYFCQVFKKKTGTTAAEYRSQP